MIYLSTGGERCKTGFDVAMDYFDSGFSHVELSGGQFFKSVLSKLKSLPHEVKIQIHNYFPPPLDPFVFNLASSDDEIFNKSFDHVLNSMDLVEDLGLEFYSFHGGFRINPNYSELGSLLKNQKISRKIDAQRIFRKAVIELADIAKTKGVVLLIENNVITKRNFFEYGENPLLFTSPDEILCFMKSMPKNVRLLVDVGHLNVSSLTLGFDKVEALINLNHITVGYHLSDNDQLSDSNSPVSLDSWFWPHLRKDLSYYSLEVYGRSMSELKRQVELTERILTS